MKNPIFRGGGHEKSIYRGELPKKKGTWTVSRFKGWGLAEDEVGGVFEGG